MSDGGHVFGSAFGTKAQYVVIQNDVEHPLETVLDAPQRYPFKRRGSAATS